MRSVTFNLACSVGCVLALLNLALPSDAEETVLRPGDRVKVEYEKRVTEKLLYVIPVYSHDVPTSITGTVTSLNEDSLAVRTDCSDILTYFSINDVKSLRVSTGRRRATLEGLWKGAAVGAVLGALFTMADPALDEERIGDSVVLVDNSPSDWAVFGSTLAAGAVIGTTIGYFSTADVWQKIILEETPVGASLRLDGEHIGIRVSYRF